MLKVKEFAFQTQDMEIFIKRKFFDRCYLKNNHLLPEAALAWELPRITVQFRCQCRALIIRTQ